MCDGARGSERTDVDDADFRGLNLFRDFNVFSDVVIPSGTFDFVSAGLELESSASRALSGRLNVLAGQFYNGSRWNLSPQLRWRQRDTSCLR